MSDFKIPSWMLEDVPVKKKKKRVVKKKKTSSTNKPKLGTLVSDRKKRIDRAGGF